MSVKKLNFNAYSLLPRNSGYSKSANIIELIKNKRKKKKEKKHAKSRLYLVLLGYFLF